MSLSREVEKDIVTVVESLGLKVYYVEYSGSKIAVYIDKNEGISVGDCERVSRNISVMLDAENPINHPYVLEVSSPGINRKLKKKEHFIDAAGKKCVVRTHKSVNSFKVFRGILKFCSENSIVVNTEGNDVNIEFDNIKRARLDEA